MKRVTNKAALFGQDIQDELPQGLVPIGPSKVNPEQIGVLYRDHIMPLTKDVQVAYLLRRLDADTPSGW